LSDLPAVSNPRRTPEQPLTTISATVVTATQTEFCAETWAESHSNYCSEFWSIFMTFICVFSVIIVDDVAYTLGCSPVSIYIFYFNYFWSRLPMVAAVWAGTPVYGAQGQWGSEGNWLI